MAIWNFDTLALEFPTEDTESTERPWLHYYSGLCFTFPLFHFSTAARYIVISGRTAVRPYFGTMACPAKDYIDKDTTLHTSSSMKKEVKLVLGGGAAYGLAHIGAIAAISEHFSIRSITGTSMGAIIGAMAAMGLEPEQMLALAEDTKTRRLFNLFNLDISRGGLFDGKAVLKRFESWTLNSSIEDFPLAFTAVAYDLISCRTILIDKGSAACAMRASSSLPTVFTPFAWGRYQFVDGGVEHPLPMAFTDQMEGNLTIAVNVLPPVSPEAIPIEHTGNLLRKRLRLHEVMVQSLMQNQGFVAVQALLSHPPDIYIDAHNPHYRLWSLDKARQISEYGYRAAQKAIVDFREPSFMEQLLKKYQALLLRRV